MLKLILYIWVLGHIFPIFNVDIKSSSTISFLSKLYLVIIFIMSTIGKQDLYDLDQKFSDTVD